MCVQAENHHCYFTSAWCLLLLWPSAIVTCSTTGLVIWTQSWGSYCSLGVCPLSLQLGLGLLSSLPLLQPESTATASSFWLVCICCPINIDSVCISISLFLKLLNSAIHNSAIASQGIFLGILNGRDLVCVCMCIIFIHSPNHINT